MYNKFEDQRYNKNLIILVLGLIIYLILRFTNAWSVMNENLFKIEQSDIIAGFTDQSFIFICIGSIIGSFTAVLFTGILNNLTEKKKIKKYAIRAANILSKDLEINTIKILSYRNYCDDKKNSNVAIRLDKLMVCDNWRMYYHDLYLYTKYDYYSCLTTFYNSINSINSAIDEMNWVKLRSEIFRFDSLEFNTSFSEYTPHELQMNLFQIIIGGKEEKPFFEIKDRQSKIEHYEDLYGKVIENKIINLLILNKKITFIDLNLEICCWLVDQKCEVDELCYELRILYEVIKNICYESDKITCEYPYVSLSTI